MNCETLIFCTKMLKHISAIFFLMIFQPAKVLNAQDTSARATLPADSLTKAIGVLDSSFFQATATKSSDTARVQSKAQKGRAKVVRRDTSATTPFLADTLKPDSVSSAQPIVTDSLEKRTATESKAEESVQTGATPIRDTTTVTPAVGVSEPDSGARSQAGVEPHPSAGEAGPEALPQTISEEAKSAEEIILRQFESLTKIFSLPRIILTLIVFALTFFAVKVATVLLTRIAKRRARLAPKLRKAIPVVNLGLWFLAIYLVTVGIFARSPLSIVIVVAVLALAFGFASRQLLQDIVGGIVIVLERPFQIGDRIRLGGHYGEVAKIGLRAFHLLSSDGSVVVIPNAEVMRQSVANANPGTMERQVTAELLLPANVDLEEAKKIAFEAAAVSPYVYTKKPIDVQVVEEYKGELLIKIIVKACVFDARYEQELRSNIIETARKGFKKI